MKHLFFFCGTCSAFVLLRWCPVLRNNPYCSGKLFANPFYSFLPDPELESSPSKLITVLILAGGTIVVLILLIVFLYYSIYRIRRRVRFMERRIDKQIRLIRSLLDLGYVYNESPQVFFEKFKDRINIRQLKSDDLIDISDKKYSHLKEDERFLCTFLDQGFTHRELCTIYNMKTVGKLYVKYHRIQAKLKQGINKAVGFKHRKNRGKKRIIDHNNPT